MFFGRCSLANVLWRAAGRTDRACYALRVNKLTDLRPGQSSRSLGSRLPLPFTGGSKGWVVALVFAALVFAAPIFATQSMGCSGGSGMLSPLPPVTVEVNDTLAVTLTVEAGGSGTYAVAPLDLPGARITVTGTAPDPGELRWTPLASHTGTHEVVVQLVDGGDVIDETILEVTVVPADDAAPVFLRPGAGGTYDLTADPTVTFDIEVRDDDSAMVEIRPNGELPQGAAIVSVDAKRARFEWEPTASQIAASERWTIPIAADDGEHDPTELNYIAVLRGAAKPGCPGLAPMVSIVAPGEGARVPNAGGYAVRAEVSDDMGLRDPPLVLYTTAAPDDPDNPDVTAFDQVVMRPDGGAWLARIPALRLDEGAEEEVYFLVTATDNDDGSGATCDHRTDSALSSFVALGGGSGGVLDGCDTCTTSEDCGSGLCATAGDGGRCVPSCSGDGNCASGTCGATVTVEGSVRAGCGPLEDVCSGGGGACVDDRREENDTIETASSLTSAISDGQICANDPDFFRIAVGSGERVTVSLTGAVYEDGDLDLQLVDSDGEILDASASTDDGEEVEFCFAQAGTAYAKVLGYLGDENSYALSATVATDPSACCADDANEPDDSASTATSISLAGGTGTFEGTICPSDDDWYSFNVSGASRVEVTMLIGVTGQDLDLELRGPSGTVIASSRGTTDEESIDTRVTASGRYTLRVTGFFRASSDYFGEVTLTEESGCTTDTDCDLARVCDGGSCVDRACTAGSRCPGGTCPTSGQSSASECGASCTVNRDCRAGEACKRLPEGRFCARTGSGGNGDACANFTTCGGQRGCIPWPSGSCARAGCVSNADCETDTYCVDRGLGYNVCARSCWDSDSICRSQYRCTVATDEDDEVQLVCVPS